MEWDVVGVARASSHSQEWVEWYLKGPDAKFGPLRTKAGRLWVGKPMEKVEAHQEYWRARKIHLEASVEKYGSREVVWMRTYSEHERAILEQEFPQRLSPVPLSVRILGLDWPSPKKVISPELRSILQSQRTINDALMRLFDEYVVPLVAEGVSVKDAVNWTKRPTCAIKNEAHRALLRSIPVADQAAKPSAHIDYLVTHLEKEAQLFDKDAFVEREETRTIVYLGGSHAEFRL